jgi:hypothetical protein
MRLDHVSYVASHDQISDVVNRIGSQIGTAFVDGGIHPKFGTRNFTAPLLNGQYIEVVCPLDHPATDQTPFGKAVRKKADEGGGWLTWVVQVDKISNLESIYGRKSVVGNRILPTGQILEWKQIGLLNVLNDFTFPYFIEWVSHIHPSQFSEPKAEISKLVFVEKNNFEEVLPEIRNILDSLQEVMPEKKLYFSEKGLIQVGFKINNSLVYID